MKIEWRGNEHTNSSTRDGVKPFMIVNHITTSTASSCDSWFRSPNNEVSSAHFLVCKDGSVKQYVDIKRMAWANGLAKENFNRATSEIVKENAPTNPNKYTISIEHEGNGETLTNAQLNATIDLHRYIIGQVKEIYGIDFIIDRKHIIGHKEIDSVNKPNCPSNNFPFELIINSLKVPHWATGAIDFCERNGLMVGDERGFRPNDTVTRAELACVVQRIFDNQATAF